MGREREQLKAKLDMVVHTFNPSTQEAEAGGTQVGGQPGLHRKILSLKKENKTNLWAGIEHKALQTCEQEVKITFSGYSMC
jgi:hypothetical protein